jgi:large-conductance mechanosensitive channel
MSIIAKLKNKATHAVIISHAASVIIAICIAAILASFTQDVYLGIYAILLGAYAVNPIQSKILKSLFKRKNKDIDFDTKDI